MDGIPSSGDAQQEAKYETLEEYIMATRRNHDEEERKSIRPWPWMTGQMHRITREIGTDKSEVANRAFSMGLKIIRDDVGEDVDEIADMVDCFLEALGHIYVESRGVDKFYRQFSEFKMELRKDYDDVTDTEKYPLKRSELSEVRTTFTEHGYMGGWIYRVVLALGLEKSAFLTPHIEEKIEKLEDDVNVTVKGSREEMESKIREFISNNMGQWLQTGLSEKSYERLRETISYMETEQKEEAEMMLQQIDKFKRTDADENGQ